MSRRDLLLLLAGWLAAGRILPPLPVRRGAGPPEPPRPRPAAHSVCRHG